MLDIYASICLIVLVQILFSRWLDLRVGIPARFPTPFCELRVGRVEQRWVLQPPDPGMGGSHSSYWDRVPFVYCTSKSYPVISTGSFVLSLCFHNSFTCDDIIKGILI